MKVYRREKSQTGNYGQRMLVHPFHDAHLTGPSNVLQKCLGKKVLFLDLQKVNWGLCRGSLARTCRHVVRCKEYLRKCSVASSSRIVEDFGLDLRHANRFSIFPLILYKRVYLRGSLVITFSFWGLAWGFCISPLLCSPLSRGAI